MLPKETMMYRNTVRPSTLAVIVAITLIGATPIAGGFTQKPAEQTEASLLTAADAIPDVAVVLKKKPDTQADVAPLMKAAAKSRPGRVAAAAKPMEKRDEQSEGKKTNKDGSFSFENVPVGTYNLTFDAPKVSPAMAGKVEYLVIVQQVEAGSAQNSANITIDQSKPKTARIPISKIQDGLEFTVGPQPQAGVFQASKPKSKNKTGATDSQTRGPKEPMKSPPAMNLRGKIFLVEIGTTRVVRDKPELKTPGE
jgi:hypothetical protein